MDCVTDLLTSDKYCLYRSILTAVGAAYALKILIKAFWSLAGGFCAYFLAPWGISRTDLKKYGSWAIVTGASEGIGRGYALELARRGLNVVIISRSEEKLEKVANEIREKYNREVRYISIDFSKGQSVYDDIQAEISDLDIAVLVNNVGLSVEYPDFFTQIDEMRHRNIIELNCQSMVQMTHLVLPKMVEKNKGIIVNLSSLSALSPTPLLNVYAATKVFVTYFSAGLRYEYKSKGIIVQSVMPGFVATAMSGIRRPKLWAPSPENYTRSAVATIGIQHDTFGYMFHAIQAYIITSIPSCLTIPMMFKTLLGAKTAAINRKRRSQKKD